MISNTMLSKRICQVCGKEIYFPCFERYAWKIGTKYFCSYTCMRKREAEITEEKKQRMQMQRERARKMRASRV